jgi:hypothetical protein
MSATTPEGKYQIWGFEAQGEFDDFNRGVNSQEQSEDRTLRCVYATDDVEEAKTIMRNGGYMRNEGTPQQTWVVAREGRTLDG